MVNRRAFVTAAALVPLASRPVAAQGEEDLRASYLGGVSVLTGIMLWSWQEFDRLSEVPEPLDETWRVDFLGMFAVPRAAQDMAARWVPPDAVASDFQNLHEHLLDAINYSVQAGEHFKIGILNDNPTEFQLGGDYKIRSDTSLKEVMELMGLL